MKKKITILLSLLFATTAITASAQSIYYGPKIGVNLTNFSQTTNAKAVVRGAMGAFAGYQVNDFIAVQAEGLLSWQGTKIGGKRYNLNYFKMPILGKITLIENLSAEAGLSLNFLLSARYAGNAVSGYNGFDLSMPVGASYRFMEKFEAGVRYDFALSDVGHAGSSTSKNRNMLFSIAYIF